jgi:heme oxygenase (biliverdin-IX-beta and delta-forming)
LKEKTMRAHEALEHLLIPKLEQINTPAAYARLLPTFYGYFSPLEAIIEQYLSPLHLPDIHHRRKASFLLNDLAALGYERANLAVSSCMPQVTNEAQAWEPCMYWRVPLLAAAA